MVSLSTLFVWVRVCRLGPILFVLEEGDPVGWKTLDEIERVIAWNNVGPCAEEATTEAVAFHQKLNLDPRYWWEALVILKSSEEAMKFREAARSVRA